MPNLAARERWSGSCYHDNVDNVNHYYGLYGILTGHDDLAREARQPQLFSAASSGKAAQTGENTP